MTVAVVVFSVAYFGAWGAWPGIANHVILSSVAHPLAFGFTNAFAQFAFVAQAFLDEGFVDLAVTIVVFAVAKFGGGSARFRVADDTITFGVADVFAGCFALAFADATSITQTLEGFVGFAVAVVVLAVAGFCCFGLGLALTRSPLAFAVAGLGSFFTDAHIGATGLCGFGLALASIIRSSITVVVLPVTGFFGDRLDFTFANVPFAFDTGLYAWSAGSSAVEVAIAKGLTTRLTRVATAGLAVDAVAAFVGCSVAVVVKAVAFFFLWFDFPCACSVGGAS